MSIQSELARIKGAKADLQSWVEENGVTVPDGTLIDGLVELAKTVETGGGGGVIMGTFTPATNENITIDLIECGLKVGTYPKARFLFENDTSFNSSSHTCRRTLAIFEVSLTPYNTDPSNAFISLCCYQNNGSNNFRYSGDSVANFWDNTIGPSGLSTYSAMAGIINSSKALLTFYTFDPTVDYKYGCIVGRSYIWGVVL